MIKTRCFGRQSNRRAAACRVGRKASGGADERAVARPSARARNAPRAEPRPPEDPRGPRPPDSAAPHSRTRAECPVRTRTRRAG